MLNTSKISSSLRFDSMLATFNIVILTWLLMMINILKASFVYCILPHLKSCPS